MKKRYLFPLLLILLVLVPCAIASAATYYYVNGTSWVRMRQLPSTDAKILASYRQDYAITSYDKYNKEWAYVVFTDGHEGYVQNKYVKSSSAKYAWITTDKTILRSGPAKSFTNLAYLPRGEKVKVLTTGNSWSYVYSTNYGYGYINKSYLSSKAISSDTKYAAFTAYVINPNYRTVNLRSAPSKSASVLAEIEPGTQVTVWEYGSTWCEVEVSDSLYGYMMSEYLSRNSEIVTIGPWPAPDIAPDPTDPPFSNYDAYITSDNGRKVNLRNGAGTGYGVIRQLPVGTGITVVQAVNKNWYRVYVDGQYGYVMSKYVTLSAPSGSSSSSDSSVSSHSAWIMSVDGTKVNVRNGAGSGYAVLTQLEAGTKVSVLDDFVNANWSHIQFSYIDGYVQSEFLTDSDPGYISGQTEVTTQASVSRFPFTAYITSDNGKDVNVRRGPGTGWALAGSVPNGAEVTVYSESGRWYKIAYNGMQGYVMQQFVTTNYSGTVITADAAADPAPAAESGSSEESVDTSSASGTATVNTPDGKAVNMRRGPGKGYANVTRVENGQTVNILGYSGRWAHVEYNGLTGYILSEYLN